MIVLKKCLSISKPGFKDLAGATDSCHPEQSTPSIASNNNELAAMSTKKSSNMDHQSGHASTPKTMEPPPNSTIEQKGSPTTKGQQTMAFNHKHEDENNFKTSSSSALYAPPPPRANSDDTLTPEPLTEALMAESRPLLAVLDLYHVECFHSKQWQLRDKALHFITQELKTYSLEGEALAIFRCVGFCNFFMPFYLVIKEMLHERHR